METFEMVAKTLQGLEQVLAEELRELGAENVEPGRRMVSFSGDLEMLYKANLCCRTALRILKPFYKFMAHTPDELYDRVKEYDWSKIMGVDQTFCIDTVAYSEDFTHSQFVTYRVKDAIVDWFRDKYGNNQRPGVKLEGADVLINVHISAGNVTLSLDSSGESLHKRGYRVAQTEAPINEVLAAGIILMTGYRGDTTFVDPMCGSGTFLIEAALIAANINPGIYRKHFAFENWPDYDAELFDRLYNDDSGEREVSNLIIGADISAAAIDIAQRNIKSAGVGKYIQLKTMSIGSWEEAPQPAGILVTNPPYGERISAPDMEGLYGMIGNRLKNVFQGYHAWVIGYRDEYFQKIGLSPSQKIDLLNGSLECQLCEYIIFEGDKKSFLAGGGRLKDHSATEERKERKPRFDDDRKPRRDDDRKPRRYADDEEEREERRFGRPGDRKERKFGNDRDRKPRRDDKFKKDHRHEDDPSGKKARRYDREGRERKYDREGREDREDRFGCERKYDREGREGREDRFGRERKFDRKGRERREDRFGRERKFDREEREGREERFGRERKYDRQPEPESENPLAKRRNPMALKYLQNKQPSLPPTEGPTMRKRKNNSNPDQK